MLVAQFASRHLAHIGLGQFAAEFHDVRHVVGGQPFPAVGKHVLFRQFAARFRQTGLDYREFLVPGTTLWQLFVYDPSGVQLELTFEGSAEVGAAPDMSPGRAYVAGSSFFNAATYPTLKTVKAS